MLILLGRERRDLVERESDRALQRKSGRRRRRIK